VVGDLTPTDGVTIYVWPSNEPLGPAGRPFDFKDLEKASASDLPSLLERLGDHGPHEAFEGSLEGHGR
jgi:hypothetical protein